MDRRAGKGITLFLCCFPLLLVVYRIYLLFRYCSQYVDGDQALMWYGTAVFGHFKFPEPCFFGQSYGSMIESLIAVPLYWIKIPFHYALPAATMVLSMIPFFYLSFKTFRKGNQTISLLILLCYISMSWKWDLLTSVSRALIGGFSFAVIGMIWLNADGFEIKYSGTSADCRKAPLTITLLWGIKVFLGAFLAYSGYIMTSSAIALIGIGGLGFCLDIKRKRKNILPAAAGFFCGLLVEKLIKAFYINNTDYALHPEWGMKFQTQILISNIKNIRNICADFTPLGLGGVFLVFMTAVLLYVFINKDYKTGILILAAAAGMTLMLGLNKMNDFIEGSLLLGQLRMLLVVPYIMILIMYFRASYSGGKASDISPKRVWIWTIIFAGLVTYKIFLFETQMRNESSILYTDAFPVWKVEDVLEQEEIVINAARDQDADVIIVNEGRETFGYALGAEYYGEFIFYNTTYDRRTWVYHELLKPDDYKVLLVDFFGTSSNIEQARVSKMSVTDYIAERFGVYRNPYIQK